MTVLAPKQEALCEQSRWDFSDLGAIFINCTLKRSPERSHTQGLADMSEHGWDRDDWPVTLPLRMYPQCGSWHAPSGRSANISPVSSPRAEASQPLSTRATVEADQE